MGDMVGQGFWGGGQLAVGIAPGSRIAGYLLEEQIGRGGMAVVFRAVDERLGRRVALKFLNPAWAADEAFRQRFIRESRAAAFVEDPHIIPVHAAGEAGGMLFIAMRLVPSGDVRTLLNQVGPLPADQAAAIVSQVASALDAAHAAGLVHRDVKPANMLVDRRPGRPDHVYLSDFGLSKGKVTSSSPALTKFGEYLGTPLYTAPEQVQGSTVDGRADQYSLACAAFEMLAGEPAFRRDHQEAVLLAHLHDPPPPLSPHRPDLPTAPDRVLAKALAKSADDRYTSCGQFADALRAALGQADDDRTITAVAQAPPAEQAPPTKLAPQAQQRERGLPSALVRALASPDDQVRRGAVEGLCELACGARSDLAQTALEMLNALVSDGSAIVSAAASTALAKLFWGRPAPDQAPATAPRQVVPDDPADHAQGQWWDKPAERWWER